MSSPASALPPPGSADVLYVVDLSGYVFRAYHALPPLTSPGGEPTGATYGTTTMLAKLVADRQPRWLAVAMDSPGPSFRVELDARYKANRPPAPPDLPPQLTRCRQIAEAWQMPTFARTGVEADDIIASIAQRALGAGLRVVIASSDKDLMQLVLPDRLWVWDAMRDRVFGPPEVAEKLGVTPERVRDYLALVGDSSDNVAGVPGVGPKTAAKLLGELGSIDGIYASLDHVDRPKLRETLRANEAVARLARALVTLRSDLDICEDVERLRFHGGALGAVPHAALRAIFAELGFARLVESLAAAPAALDSSTGAAAATADRKPVTGTGVAAAGTDEAPANRAVSGSSGDGPGRVTPVRIVRTSAELAQLVAELRPAGELALTALGTSSEPMRSALVGLALQAGPGGPSAYLPLGHRVLDAGAQLPLAAAREQLAPLLQSRAVGKLGHDLKHSAVLLEHHGLPLRGVCFDSMLASYLLDPEASHELGRLCEASALGPLPTMPSGSSSAKGRALASLDELGPEQVAPVALAQLRAVAQLRERQLPLLRHEGLDRLLAELELPLLEVLAAMELRGVLLRPGPLGPLGEELGAEMATLERQAYEAAGREFNLASPRQLETILYDELGLKPTRKTKTGRSTDAEALEASADAHPLPRLVLEHRALAKLKGTYVDTLPTLVHPETGRIHGRWDQAVAATGRLASKDPNLQNIPVRTSHGKRIREAFTAPEGKLVLSADYSQIELRVLAHLSKDPALCDAFQSGADVHARTAMAIFGVEAADVTDAMRRQSKTVNFGIIYGMGAVALAKRLGIGRPEASRFIEAYLERYRGVRAFMDQTLALARETREVRTLLGRVRRLPDIASSNHQRRAYAERIAQNTPIQGTAADLLKLAMVKLAEPLVPGAQMVLTVHDELVFEVPADAVAEAAARAKQVMETVFPLDVPLRVDVGWGPSWAKAH